MEEKKTKGVRPRRKSESCTVIVTADINSGRSWQEGIERECSREKKMSLIFVLSPSPLLTYMLCFLTLC